MDRATVYFGQTPLETDILRSGQYAMVGLAKLSEAALGTGTVVAGFPIAPTVPASLAVSLGAGQVYEQENLEASAWSSLPADTHVIVKQGLLLDPVPLTFTPPATPGYSQCFLVEVQYQDSDTLPVQLPYYNAANPLVTLNGPAGSGAQQNTDRKGAVAYQVKAGVATSGTPSAPAPDAGWVGLYVITLAQGATTVTAGNIALYAGAPFIPVTLPGVPNGVQSGQWRYGIDSGTASNLVIALNPAPAALTVGMEIIVKPAAAPTGATVANVAGLGNLPVVRRGDLAVQNGDWNLGDFIALRYTGAAWMLAGLVPSDIAALISTAQQTQQTTTLSPGGRFALFGNAGTFSWTVPAGVYAIRIRVWGAGGAGGGSYGSGGAGTGGAGGGYSEGNFAVTPGQVLPIIIGAGGVAVAGSSSGGGNGGTGGTTSVSNMISATGGGGGGGALNSIANYASVAGQGNGGSYNVTGGGGGTGTNIPSATPLSGVGGYAYTTPGAPANQNTAGNGGTFPAGGGAGASTSGNTALAGGVGANGLAIINY